MPVTSISPTSGGIGSIVTITGSGFTGATGVMFSSNGYPALTTEFIVDSDTQIQAVVPSYTGTFSIQVFVPQEASSDNEFTITPPW